MRTLLIASLTAVLALPAAWAGQAGNTGNGTTKDTTQNDTTNGKANGRNQSDQSADNTGTPAEPKDEEVEEE